MPDTTISTLPSVSRQISSAVVLRWIRKLLEDEAIWNPRGDFIGLGHGALHALRPLGEHKARPENLENFAALHGHRIGHREDELETLRRSDERKRDSGVPAGRLDEDSLRVNFPAFQSVVDHR
jgi:hypothetical protein